jgi:hypothetical protein
MNEINPKYENTRKIQRLLTNQNPGFLYKVTFFPSAVVFARTYFTFLPSRAANRQIHSEYHCLAKQIEILPLYLLKGTVQSVL